MKATLVAQLPPVPCSCCNNQDICCTEDSLIVSSSLKHDEIWNFKENFHSKWITDPTHGCAMNKSVAIFASENRINCFSVDGTFLSSFSHSLHPAKLCIDQNRNNLLLQNYFDGIYITNLESTKFSHFISLDMWGAGCGLAVSSNLIYAVSQSNTADLQEGNFYCWNEERKLVRSWQLPLFPLDLSVQNNTIFVIGQDVTTWSRKLLIYDFDGNTLQEFETLGTNITSNSNSLFVSIPWTFSDLLPSSPFPPR